MTSPPDGADRPARGLFGRVAGRVTERVVETVQPDLILDHVDIDSLVARVDIESLVSRLDLDAVLDRVDPDRLLDRVDVEALLARIDLDALVARIDLDRVLARVDVNALLDRVEPGPLLARVDVNALLDRVDPNRLLDRVDTDSLVARVDVRALVARSGAADLVAQSTGQMATSALDVARRQVVGLDTVVNRAVSRLLRRDLATLPEAPPRLAAAAASASGPDVTPARRSATGHFAGAVPRALAAILDVLVVFATYTLGYAGVGVLASAFFGVDLGEHRSGVAATVALVAWAFCYVFGTTAVSGRTLGKAIVGLRVVHADGTAVSITRAFVRTLAVPLSAALFGLGFLWCVVDPRRRTLHDHIAGTAVVHDWGDRPVELSAPLSAFLDRASARV